MMVITEYGREKVPNPYIHVAAQADPSAGQISSFKFRLFFGLTRAATELYYIELFQ